MSSAPTLTWQQYQKLPPEKRQRPLTPAEYAALNPTQRENLGLDPAQQGVPADFSGPVFANPDHVQPQLDSDSAVPVTRLPNGVSFQQGNWKGKTPGDVSNPAPAEILPPAIRTVGAKMSTPATLPADFQGWDKPPDILPTNFNGWDAAAAPPVDPGTLGKVWNWANQGLLSGKTLLNVIGAMVPRSADMKPGESTSDYLSRVQNHIDPDHPYLNAIKVGLAGVDKDTADTISNMFTSPLGLATLSTAGAGKIPGVAGKAARLLGGLAAAGFAGKGASSVLEAGTENTPEAWQQRLQGAAMAAGGAAGVGETAEPAVAPTIRGVAKAANTALHEGPGAVGAALGGAVGHATGIPEGTLSGVIIGRELGNKFAKSLRNVTVPGTNYGLPEATDIGAVPVRGLSKQPLGPAAPAPELTQSSALASASTPPAQSAAETGAALSTLPAPAVQQALQELGPQAPISNITARAQQIAKGSTANGSPYSVDEVQPGQQIPEPRSRAELEENKAIEEQVREQAAREQQQRIHESRLQYRAPTKNALVTQAGGNYPQQPVKFTRTPSLASSPPPTATPAAPAPTAPTPATDDLTDLLLESLRRAQKK